MNDTRGRGDLYWSQDDGQPYFRAMTSYGTFVYGEKEKELRFIPEYPEWKEENVSFEDAKKKAEESFDHIYLLHKPCDCKVCSKKRIDEIKTDGCWKCGIKLKENKL
jgi:hypothetical protein